VTAPSAPARLDHAAVRRIMFGLMLALLLAALDQTIVATALATIGRSYGDVASLAWVVTAYLLAATAATPLYGKLSDIHGRRPVMLAGIAIFVVGSVACALAPSMPALIVARAVQGIGGGGLIALAQTIVGDAVSPRERGRYQGYFAVVFATASIAGPVVGGVFAEHLHWTLIFWVNLPIGVAAFIMTSRALKALPRHERRHDLDFLGAALMVTATVALLLALNWGEVRYPWISWQIAGLVAAAIVLFALFAWRITVAPEPFLPLELLRNRVVTQAIGTASFAYGTMIALSIYTPVYFETVLRLTASEAGLMLIPLMGGVVVGSLCAGQLMSRVARYKRVGLIGMPFAVVALLPLVLSPAWLTLGMVALLLFVTGIGIGSVLPLTTVAVQNAVLPWQMGTVTGLMNFMRALASALMVALYGAFLFGAAGQKGVTLETLGAAHDLALSHFRLIFAAAAVCLALSWVLLLVMEERPLRTTPLREEGMVPAE
jgi:EmrB/QacA subfamily drug resistance transporter